MNAHAMISRLEVIIDSAALANRINEYSFDRLQVLRGAIELEAGEALYLYGGRQSLISAITKLGHFRIVGDAMQKIALFRVSRTVAKSMKTKQLLVITPVPHGGFPSKLKPYQIPVQGNGSYFGLSNDELITDDGLITTLNNLPKK